MIYICTHTKPAYTLEGSIIVDNTKSMLPEDYGHVRGIDLVSKMDDLPEEIGIFQQRRYLQPCSIPEGYDVVVPFNFCICNIREQFARCHIIEYLDIAEQVIDDDLFSKYIRIDNNYECYWDAMFIMRKNCFLEYARFVIEVLKKKDEIAGTSAQNRFLVERIGSFWIWKTFKRERICVGNRIQID